MTPGHWIAIATIAVAVLGAVIGWGMSEHTARIETKLDLLIQLHR